MTDIASLGIKVDSTQAGTAAQTLDQLAAAGGRTESAIGRLGRVAREFGSGLRTGAREGLREFGIGTTNVGAASRAAAGEMTKVTRAATQQSAVLSGASRVMRRYVALLAAAFSVREIVRAADTYANLSARLLLATGSSEKFAAAQAELSNIAFRTRSSLEGTIDLFAKMTQSTRDLGVSQSEVLAVTESINKAMALSGTSAQAASAALIQLGQAFGSGQLRGEELRSVMENSLRLSQAIADGMGISVGKLRTVAEEGKLTSEVVFKALQKSSGQIDREFARLPMTIGGATTQVRSALIELIGEFSAGTKAGSIIAEAISDVASYIRELAKNVKQMADNGDLQRWIDDARDGFDILIQLIRTAIAGFEDLAATANVVSGSFDAVFADLKVASAVSRNAFGGVFFESNRKALENALEERNNTVRDANERLAAFLNRDSEFKRAMRDLGRFEIGDRNRRRRAALVEEPPVDIVPQRPGATDTPLTAEQRRAAEQMRKAMMDAQLGAIRRQLNELTSAYAAAESILDAQRSAGIISEQEYYTKKRGFIRMNADAQVEALQAENARLAAEKATGAERIKVQSKIAENESKIESIRLKATASTEVLAIQQTEALRSVARSYEEARQAAQAYLDTLVQQQRRELEGMGMGERFRDRNAGLTQIDDRYQGQRDELANNRALLQMEGKWTAESQQQYEKRLAIINDFHARARESYDEYWQYRAAREADWTLGLSEGLNNYLDEARNVYQQTADAVGNAMRGMEDALVSFVTKGKLDFRSLADSIIADIMRIQIRKMITGAFDAIGLGALLKPNALGNVYQSPSLSAYSNDVYNTPQLFAFAKGAGVFAEAGPEAIMPLKRGKDGRLGVSSEGGGINIKIDSTVNAAPGVNAAQFGVMLDQRDRALEARLVDGLRRGRYPVAVSA